MENKKEMTTPNVSAATDTEQPFPIIITTESLSWTDIMTDLLIMLLVLLQVM